MKLQKVAVIGSGPAGLAAAATLSLKGYKTTIFEGKEKAGGWLTYGIVPARLPQEIVDYEVDYVKNLGVEFKMNTRIGTDITLDQLKEEGYEAICVSVGLQSSATLDIPGVELSGVTTAVDFLSAAKPTKGAIEIPNDVIIIGGGDVAMDCATTAKLLGAKKVTIIYRRTIEEMPATKAELQHVNGLGICVLSSAKPVEIIGENGKAKAFKAAGLDWLDRNTSVEVPESNIQLKAELVIQAIGQKAEEISYTGLEVNGKGLVISDPETGKTNIDYVFAAGDIVNGGKTVVEAVARGKAAANSIDEYLSNKRNCNFSVEEVVVEKEGER